MYSNYSKSLSRAYRAIGAAIYLAASDRRVLTLAGLLACLAVQSDAFAAFGDGRTSYNDARIVEATNAVFTYLEGSFGALVMVIAGVGAILSAAFGQYRSALGLFVVAIGSFILRSIVSTFFNDVGIKT